MRMPRFRGLLRAGFEQRQRSEPRHCSTQHGSLSGAQCVSPAGTQPAWGVGAHESICVLRRTACGIRHTTDTLHQPHVLPVHRLELFLDWDCQVNLHQPTRMYAPRQDTVLDCVRARCIESSKTILFMMRAYSMLISLITWLVSISLSRCAS